MLDIILDTFKNLTPILWASQICGLIGFALILISYQFKKKVYLILAMMATLFFFTEQLLAGLYSNMVVTFSSLIRNFLLLIFLVKKNSTVPRNVVYILLGAVWCAEIVVFAITKSFLKWDNYLPPLLYTEFTLLANHKNYYVLKGGALILETGFFIYYSVYGLPFSMLRQATLVVSILVSIVVMIIKDIQKNKKTNSANA